VLGDNPVLLEPGILMTRPFAPILTLFIAFAVSLLTPFDAIAADSVAGKWQGTLESPRGANQITLKFNGTDEALQGTWTGPRGTSDLRDVKYERPSLTFARDLAFAGNSVTLNCTATIDGDTMSVTMRTPRGERQFTANRVK
jgi:hypothetical protein